MWLVPVGDIAAAKEAGAAGVVIGALTAEGEVDVPLTQRLLEAAKPELAVTFHRAIDLTRDPLAAVRTLLDLGAGQIQRVLTSGGAATAPEGLETIRRMEQLCQAATGEQADEVVAEERRLVIVPGGGLTVENVAQVAARTGVRMLHASLRSGRDGGMSYRKPGVFMGGKKVIRSPQPPTVHCPVNRGRLFLCPTSNIATAVAQLLLPVRGRRLTCDARNLR